MKTFIWEQNVCEHPRDLYLFIFAREWFFVHFKFKLNGVNISELRSLGWVVVGSAVKKIQQVAVFFLGHFQLFMEIFIDFFSVQSLRHEGMYEDKK